MQIFHCAAFPAAEMIVYGGIPIIAALPPCQFDPLDLSGVRKKPEVPIDCGKADFRQPLFDDAVQLIGSRVGLQFPQLFHDRCCLTSSFQISRVISIVPAFPCVGWFSTADNTSIDLLLKNASTKSSSSTIFLLLRDEKFRSRSPVPRSGWENRIRERIPERSAPETPSSGCGSVPC